MKMEWLTGRNGLQVPGWNGIDGEKIVVIMAHGFGSAKEGFTPKFMNLGLKKAGIGFYGFDFPAHGDSPIDGGRLTVQRCIDSYQAAEQRAIELAPDAEICYFGSSFGAYMTVLYLAAEAHKGSKAFLRSAAIDMPKLTWKIGEQRGMTFNEEGYCMLTDYNRPLKLTKAFCEDLEQHDPFACYRKGMAQLRMIHGELDSTASPVIAKQFAEEKGAEFLLFLGRSIGSWSRATRSGRCSWPSTFSNSKGKPSGTVS